MSDASHAINKRYYEKRMNAFEYQVGDRVMLFRKVPKRGEYYKFVRPWRPATIVGKRGELNYKIRTEDGKMLSVHHNRLKPNPSPAREHVDLPDCSPSSPFVLQRENEPDSGPSEDPQSEPYRPPEIVLNQHPPPPPLPLEPLTEENPEFSLNPASLAPEPVPSAAPQRRSTRARKPPDRYCCEEWV